MGDRTEPDKTTLRAERAEEERAHTADRPATADENAAADQEVAETDAEERRRVAEHVHEMNEIGAAAEGEGAIE